jgi:hypothetical protein
LVVIELYPAPNDGEFALPPVLEVGERARARAHDEIEIAVAVEVAERGSRGAADVLAVQRIGPTRDRDERGRRRTARVPEVEERARQIARQRVEVAIAVDVRERGRRVARSRDGGERVRTAGLLGERRQCRVRGRRRETQQRDGERRRCADRAQDPAQVPLVAAMSTHERARGRADLLARRNAVRPRRARERAFASRSQRRGPALGGSLGHGGSGPERLPVSHA